MQVLSHSTRAYILNANSLQGFLNSVEIMSVLRASSSEVEALRSQQVIDLQKVGVQLGELETLG